MKKIVCLLIFMLIAAGLVETKRSHSRRLGRKRTRTVNCDNKENEIFCAYVKNKEKCNNGYDKDNTPCIWYDLGKSCSTNSTEKCEFTSFFKKIFSK